jgi:hypothetical protein
LPSFTFITVRQKLEKTFECYKYKESCLWTLITYNYKYLVQFILLTGNAISRAAKKQTSY